MDDIAGVLPSITQLRCGSKNPVLSPGQSNRALLGNFWRAPKLLAYGFNRDDYTYIPGGPIPGVSFMRPEFLDLKDFPYYYNQTEYVIHGAGSYIFDVLAAQWIVQHQPERR